MNWRPGQPVCLGTERFELRSLGEGDATERYLGWLRDAEVMRYVNARRDETTLEELRSFIRRHDNRDNFLLGIFTKSGGLHIGNLSAECHPIHRTAKLGVLIGDRAFWGKRAVLEVRTIFLDFLFGPAAMVKVWGPCYAHNVPALFNYRMLGFTVEGVQRSHVVCDGERMDVVNFAMFREDWQALRAASGK
ncbi:MAG: GNAT family N-acetyltransferase [Gammaproteobacteria bacterium]|nr:GNAT family N-acetyltransferase [Gammaproteobacteria bacterium]